MIPHLLDVNGLGKYALILDISNLLTMFNQWEVLELMLISFLNSVILHLTDSLIYLIQIWLILFMEENILKPQTLFSQTVLKINGNGLQFVNLRMEWMLLSAIALIVPIVLNSIYPKILTTVNYKTQELKFRISSSNGFQISIKNNSQMNILS